MLFCHCQLKNLCPGLFLVAQYFHWNHRDWIWFHSTISSGVTVLLPTSITNVAKCPTLEYAWTPIWNSNCFTKSISSSFSVKANMSMTEFKMNSIWFTRVKYYFMIFITGSKKNCIWHTNSLWVFTTCTITLVMPPLHASAKPS